MPLFHVDLGFPRNVIWPEGTYDLHYGNHARQAARADRYGDVTDLLPDELNTRQAKVVEAEIVGRRVIKIVYRIRLDSTRDLCLVVNSHQNPFFVRTVWVNESTDRHRSLDKTRYSNLACA